MISYSTNRSGRATVDLPDLFNQAEQHAAKAEQLDADGKERRAEKARRLARKILDLVDRVSKEIPDAVTTPANIGRVALLRFRLGDTTANETVSTLRDSLRQLGDTPNVRQADQELFIASIAELKNDMTIEGGRQDHLDESPQSDE